jgi:RNA polymerase sigma-70 factor (ECF subfamily)
MSGMTPRFEELIDRHHDELFTYLWRMVGKDRGADISLEVDDLVQEVFLRAYENYNRLRPDSNARAWLYKIATNYAITKLRRLKKQREAASLLRNMPPAVHDDSRAPANMAGRIKEVLAGLPGKQRACVTLRYLQDLDYSEIAQALDCSQESARANVYQAIQRLRVALKDDS